MQIIELKPQEIQAVSGGIKIPVGGAIPLIAGLVAGAAVAYATLESKANLLLSVAKYVTVGATFLAGIGAVGKYFSGEEALPNIVYTGLLAAGVAALQLSTGSDAGNASN